MGIEALKKGHVPKTSFTFVRVLMTVNFSNRIYIMSRQPIVHMWVKIITS